MKPPATLTPHPRAGADRIDLRLRSVRLKHMLDQARTIIGLCADGREKLTGAYIFDSHYIFSLVDKIIDLSREMVFDASVIAPDGIRTCYSAFDNCKATAEALFLDGSQAEDTAAADDFEDTVEYRLLQQALDWVGGPGDDRPHISVFGLLDRVLRHVFAGFGQKPPPMPYRLDFACGAARQRIALVDLDGAVRGDPDSAASLDDLRCRPLELLLEGACPDGGAAAPATDAPARKWWALAGPADVSLFNTNAEAPTWLDADLGETDEERHLLLWSPVPVADTPEPAPHCRAPLPAGEILLWKTGEADSGLDRTLIALAKTLFSDAGPAGGSGA